MILVPLTIRTTTAVIHLSGGKSCLVDSQDWSALSGFAWDEKKNGRTSYANHRHGNVLMHRMILGFPAALIDHINHNGLDNRRRNLRLCDKSINAYNGLSHVDSTCEFKGVSWSMKERRWIAQIQIDGRQTRLGSSRSAVNAAIAYRSAANLLSKECATERVDYENV
jgi:hypothetical protein